MSGKPDVTSFTFSTKSTRGYTSKMTGKMRSPEQMGVVTAALCGHLVDDADVLRAAPDLKAALRRLLSQQSFPTDRAWWVKEREEGRGDAELVIAAIDALSKAEGLSAGVEDGR